MNYTSTVNWLFQQLPMYQKQGISAYKADLGNIQLLDVHLGHPHKHFKSVHVAGTNGKGSVSHMLASIFQEAGRKVGLYTSPHLKDYRERIKINGVLISEDSVVEFVSKNKLFFETHQLSFFEMSVGMAFQYFSEQKVDIAIVEVGLGGRLDSTNIITPELSIITNIGLDHTNLLGNNLTAISKEKAGIIKHNVPVIIGQTTPETRIVFETTAKDKNAPIFFSEDTTHPQYESDLKGDYQTFNKQTVIEAVKNLSKQWGLTTEHITQGLLNVVKNTALFGRWQILQQEPLIICDTAHNQEGLKIVLRQISSLNFKKLHIVIGVVNDKDLASILPLFPKSAQYYFCKPDVPRGLDAAFLAEKAAEHHLFGETHSTVLQALKQAKQIAAKNDLIFVGGSTFTVAEII